MVAQMRKKKMMESGRISLRRGFRILRRRGRREARG